MYRTMKELETFVRDRICGVCTDRTVDGDCGREEPESCALFRLFPQVAAAIQSVNSDEIQDYVEAIRSRVCTVCAWQGPEGECEERKQVRCALDAYLIPVVDLIEEAAEKPPSDPTRIAGHAQAMWR